MSQNVNAKTDNCLSLFRFMSALYVVLLHLYDHGFYSSMKVINVTLGAIGGGVQLFFSLSGYVIWLSLKRGRTLKKYLKARFWRIYPEMWVGIFFSVIPIILLKNPSILSVILYVIAQGTICQFWTPNSLRCYGVGVPNGSLWTIGITIQFYIFAYFFYKIFKNKKFIHWLMLFAFSIAISAIPVILLKNYPEILTKLYNQTIFRYFYVFLVGIILAEYKDNVIKYLEEYCYLLLAVCVLLKIFYFRFEYLIYNPIEVIIMMMFAIGFSYRYPQFTIKKDLSYGIFIYHMIFINLFVELSQNLNIYQAIIIIIFSMLASYVSLITVGKWSKQMGNK